MPSLDPPLSVHPFIARLHREGAGHEPLVKLAGYVGVPGQPGKVRLHFSIEDLTQYVELDEEAVVLTAEAPETVLPRGGMFLWVKASARVHAVRSAQMSAGALASALLRARGGRPGGRDSRAGDNLRRAWSPRPVPWWTRMGKGRMPRH